jgi:threonyl-tRNA synthetase
MLKVVLKDGSVVDSNDEEGRRALRHTASHTLAQAVKRLYPSAKLAIGPTIDNGFYYDFDMEESFTMEILEKIEMEMRKIVKEELRLERIVVSREEALKLWKRRVRVIK